MNTNTDGRTLNESLGHAKDACGSAWDALAPSFKAFATTFEAEYNKGMEARLVARLEELRAKNAVPAAA